jgi:putative Mg2+ transporter-C (MgtC) family protein
MITSAALTVSRFGAYVAEAFALGACIGAERQWRQRRAGLRTNALVSTGAAMFVALHGLSGGESSLRVASQVVTGIGFLGAGVILREGLSVRGLNTAATLWCTAAVGTLAGMGFPREALVGTCAVILANVLLRPVAQKIDHQPTATSREQTLYLFRLTCTTADEGRLRALLLHVVQPLPLALRALQKENLDTSKVEIRALLLCAGRMDSFLQQAVGRLSLESGTSAVSWEVVGQESE